MSEIVVVAVTLIIAETLLIGQFLLHRAARIVACLPDALRLATKRVS